MKKYQPERTDLLINSEWGIPESDVSRDEARQRGLVLFKGRWVTRDERNELKIQSFAYRCVRVVALLFALAAGLVAVALFAHISRYASMRTVVILGILLCACLATAVGLYKFKRWAFHAATLLLVVGTVQGLVSTRILGLVIGIVQTLATSGGVLLLIAVLSLWTMLRKPTRRIFSSSKREDAPS
ncbi:MAG: hypothetical protein LDL33_12480 [Desulfomonile sp.]|nr:hypothetical protein [Desulfomonile sp.]